MLFLMSLIRRVILFSALIFLVACDKDYHSVGTEILLETSLESKKMELPIYSFQKRVNYFQTDGLPLGQLGKIELEKFGTTQAGITAQLTASNQPVFGIYSQSREEDEGEDSPTVIPENETVTQVYLEIPFFNNLDDRDGDGVIDALDLDPDDRDSDTDGDGLTDYNESQAQLNPLSNDSDGDGILDDKDGDNKSYESENKIYEIDSIFGNRSASFNIKVYELKYFLSELNPTFDFEKRTQYFSNTDYFEEGFYGATLHDDTYQLNFDELRFKYKEDDPDTDDVDETEKIETRLTPRIRVPLDPAFFQEKILDQEGENTLSDAENFSRHLRGLIIKVDNFSDDLYMLLDVDNALVRIEYEYDQVNTNDTSDNTADDTIEKKASSFLLNFGLFFNTIKNNNGNLDASIEQEVLAGQNNQPSKNIYLNGGGLYSTLNLFGNNSAGADLLEQLRAKDWVINEANIVLYLDQSVYGGLGASGQLPDRLYLYRYDNGFPLTDFNIDKSVNESLKNRNKYIYGGILEYDDQDRPYRYKFRITDHVNRMIKLDSTNIALGLVSANGINNIGYKAAQTSDDQFIRYPVTAILNPRGVVLLGSEGAAQEDEAGLKFEIHYTDY